MPIVVIQNDSPASSTTAVSICSNALLMLGDLPIADFTEDTKRAKVMANLYPGERNALLRRHPWNCCTRRVVLSPDLKKPAFGYANAFSLPGDCIRLLSIDAACGDFQLEDRKILSNAAALSLRYLWRNTVEASWDELLVRAMTLAMAARACYAITASSALSQAFLQEFMLAMKEARGVDAQENLSQSFGDDGSLIAVRG